MSFYAFTRPIGVQKIEMMRRKHFIAKTGWLFLVIRTYVESFRVIAPKKMI